MEMLDNVIDSLNYNSESNLNYIEEQIRLRQYYGIIPMNQYHTIDQLTLENS